MAKDATLNALAMRLETVQGIKSELAERGIQSAIRRGLGATGPFQWDIRVESSDWHVADKLLYGSHFHKDCTHA